MVAAYIFIQLSATDFQKVVAGLRAISTVKQAHVLLGPTDSIAYVECPSQESLRETILAIRAVHGVVNTDTRYVYT